MNAELTNSNIDLNALIIEAEAYCAHGLLKESLDLYQDILAKPVDIDVQTQNILTDRIYQLRTTIKESDKYDKPTMPPSVLSLIRQTWSGESTVLEMLDSAAAFIDLGLYREALVEYQKLFHRDYPLDKIIPRLFNCLFKIHPPSIVTEQIDLMIQSRKLSQQEAAWIKFRLGLEMERRDLNDLALELFETAASMDSAEAEFRARADGVRNKFSFTSRYDYLLKNNRVTTEVLQKSLAYSREVHKSVEHVLVERFNVAREDVGKSLAFFYQCPYKDFDAELRCPQELLGKLKKSFLLQDLWVPLRYAERRSKNSRTDTRHTQALYTERSRKRKIIEILIDDPSDTGKINNIKLVFGNVDLTFCVGIKEDIEAYINAFFRTEAVSGGARQFLDDFVDTFPNVAHEEEDQQDDEQEGVDENSGQLVQFVNQVLVEAYNQNASDIHIEPSPIIKKTSIRFRIDGVCQEYLQVPNSIAGSLLSRLKIMANLDIAEKRLPQDGKIKFNYRNGPSFELRLATLPTAGGYEDAVLRILAKSSVMKLNDMGLIPRNLEVLKKIVHQPYGMVLVVGPTGSGKTTTLHATLGHINRPEIKIWTAEDPVEISQLGLRQVEVKPKIGLDFARIMRSFLRADPDVIMIGEMRDEETAAIGIEASLTGHLVFSTLHTNSAPETVTRLLDMGMNPLNFSDALLGVLAQRLVRKLCPKCREKYHPTEEEFEDIAKDYGVDLFRSHGFGYHPDLYLYRAVGCDACHGSGYRGRMGIHELMEGTKELKRLIKKAAGTDEILEEAEREGMRTLIQDGIHKVFDGLTSIDEVRRVCIN